MLRKILKNSILISLWKAAGAGSFFLFGLVISNNYSQSFFGAFNLILLIINFVTIFSKVGLDYYVVRKVPEYKSDLPLTAAFISKVFMTVLLVSIAFAALFWMLSGQVNSRFFAGLDAGRYLRWLPAIIVIYSCYLVYVEIFRGYHRPLIYTFYRQVTVQVLCLSMVVLSYFVVGYKTDPVYIYYAATIAVSAIVFVHIGLFFRKESFKLSYFLSQYPRPLMKYSLPMTTISSMMFLMGYIDSFMISWFLGLKSVGAYSAVVKISTMITFITSSVATYIASGIVEAHTKNDGRVKIIFWQTLKIVALLCIPIYLVILFFPSFLLGMYGAEYVGAKNILPLYGFASLMNSLPFGYFLVMTDNQQAFQKIAVVACILNISLNLVLIPHLGILGAAISTLVSYTTWNGSSFVLLRRLKLV